jgi:hypothetical protein
MATTDDKSSDLWIGIRAACELILELFEEDSLNSALAWLFLFLNREEVRWTYKGVRGQPRPGYTLEQEVDLIWETPDLLTVSESGSKVSRVTSYAGEPPAAVQVWGICIRRVDLIARAKVLGAPKQPRPRDLPTAVRFADLAAVELQDLAHFPGDVSDLSPVSGTATAAGATPATSSAPATSASAPAVIPGTVLRELDVPRGGGGRWAFDTLTKTPKLLDEANVIEMLQERCPVRGRDDGTISKKTMQNGVSLYRKYQKYLREQEAQKEQATPMKPGKPKRQKSGD